MKKSKLVIGICSMIVCVTLACGTQNKIVSVGQQANGYVDFSPEKFLRQIKDNSCKSKWISAKIKCTIAMDEKDICTNGMLRMKQGEVIQIILNDPVAGILELGRLEFSVDKFKMLDRFNKRFIDISYDEVEFLRKSNMNFTTLENLFWNKLFLPSKDNVTSQDFEFKDQDGEDPSYNASDIVLKHVDNMLTYQFFTRYSDASLVKTVITGTKDPDSIFEFVYQDFKDFQGRAFPHDMCMSFIMGKQNASIHFTMNSVKNKSGWETQTSIPSKYKQIDPEKLFKSLIGQ